MSRRSKAAVAMSGGVDSSVAAALLLGQGFEVIGLTLDTGARNGEENPEVRAAQKVAEFLGIRHSVLDVKADFRRLVIEPFLESYSNGVTPVPCAACNRGIKFGLLLERARETGAEFLAAGHYARLGGEDSMSISMPLDRQRDQTYFLYDVPRVNLRHIRFPLGEMTKAETRARARAMGLPTAEKPASREICFVEKAKTREYLERRLADRPGPVVDSGGRKLGEHRGVHFFTVGQRRGLGLGGFKGGVPAARPLHVIALDGPGNLVIVGPEEELFSSSCVVDRVNLFCEAKPGEEVTVKIRSGHSGTPAGLRRLAGNALGVDFLSPQRAVTPGQAAVFYRGETMLGGGTIRKAESSVSAVAGR